MDTPIMNKLVPHQNTVVLAFGDVERQVVSDAHAMLEKFVR